MPSESSYATTQETTGSFAFEFRIEGAHSGTCSTDDSANDNTGEFSMSFSDVAGTITGIEVLTHCEIGDADDYFEVHLYDSNSEWQIKDTAPPPDTDFNCALSGDVIVGGSTDLWGGTWTAAHIKSNSFRIRWRSKATAKAGSAWGIDYATITVYYTGGVTDKGFADAISGTDALTTPYREMGISDTIAGVDVFIIDYRALGFSDVASGTDVYTLLRSLGFVDTITGTDVLTLTRPVYFSDAILGTDVITTPYREITVSDTGTGTDAPTTPFRIMGFVSSALGTDVFDYTSGIEAKGFVDTVTGIDSFIVAYREISTIDTLTGTDAFTIVYRTMGITDYASAIDIFQKAILGELEDIVIFIEHSPIRQMTIDMKPLSHINITIEPLIQIFNHMEDL